MEPEKTDLLEALTPEYVGALLCRTIRVRAEFTTAERAELRARVRDFVCGHLGALDTVLQRPTWVAENRELVGELLRHAAKIARGEPEREWVAQRAEQCGLKELLMPTKVLSSEAAEPILTRSQTTVLEELEAIGRVFFHGRGSDWLLQPRWATLVAGPTGIGKSHLIHLVAKRLRVETLRFGTTNWLPAGSRAEPQALKVVLEAVRRGQPFLLHLEEVDKFVGKSPDSWTSAHLSELLMLLDGSVGAPWTEADRERFRSGVLVVASGAFQEIYDAGGGGVIGFGAAAKGKCDAARRIRLARKLPTELMARFGQTLVLDPLDADEFQRLAERVGLEEADYDIGEAVRSGQNIRFLESMLARKALNRERVVMQQEREAGVHL